MNYPIVNKGISLNEIPDRVAVFFEFGGCKQKCKGCHSENWNTTPICKELYTPLEDMVAYAEKQKAKGANAIVLMGGTNNHGVGLGGLGLLIEALSKVLPVGLYSGLEDKAQVHKFLKEHANISWLKTGSYKEELGGLTSPNTNQKFYMRFDGEDETTYHYWNDMTFIFKEEQ